MTQKLSIATVALIAVAVTACSGGGTTVHRTRYCSVKENPIKLKDKKFRDVVELDPTKPFVPADGKYEFKKSHIYFNDEARDLRFEISVTRKQDKDTDKYVYDFDVECAGGTGITPNMKQFRAGLPIVTDFVSASGNILVRNLTVIFEFGPENANWRDVEFLQEDERPGSPKDTYADYASNQGVFAKIKSTDRYEIRARLVDTAPGRQTSVDQNLDLRVLVSYDRKDN